MKPETEIEIKIKANFDSVSIDLSSNDGQEIRALGIIDETGTELGAILDLLNTTLKTVYKYK